MARKAHTCLKVCDGFPMRTHPASASSLPRLCLVTRHWRIINADGDVDRVDGDGVVGGADLTILLGEWGSCCVGDLNGDGIVDGADLTILLSCWSV